MAKQIGSPGWGFLYPEDKVTIAHLMNIYLSATHSIKSEGTALFRQIPFSPKVQRRAWLICPDAMGPATFFWVPSSRRVARFFTISANRTNRTENAFLLMTRKTMSKHFPAPPPSFCLNRTSALGHGTVISHLVWAFLHPGASQALLRFCS